MKSLIIENVRCFADEVIAPLAPLTLLVGENSTGKSTFLAAVRLASQLTQPFAALDFNEEPFLLGAYEQIANYRGGKAGRAKSFKIGFEILLPAGLRDGHLKDSPQQVRLTGEFVNKGSQPFLRTWLVRCDPAFEFSIVREEEKALATLTVRTPSQSELVVRYPASSFPPEFALEPTFLQVLLTGGLPEQMGVKIEGEAPPKEELKFLTDLLGFVRSLFRSRVYASAPIRTEPRRTYEPLKDVPRPSGGHVPMILAKIYGGSEWQQMEATLRDFGGTSRLFETVKVKRLGQLESSPFQILVKVHGPPSNLVDVGYGVSQVLPIVVDMLRANKGCMFLFQQPEVHLHPRAQAALGSLLGQLVKTDGKRFVVETHSDYLVDRIRMDVRDKKSLQPENVVVLYFQQEKSGVEIHPMTVDQNGNFTEVPAGYRWFFLEEQRRFLGIE